MPASSNISASSKMPTSSKMPSGSKAPTALPPVATSLHRASKKKVLQHKSLKPKPIRKLQPIQNRVKVLLVHIPKFSIQGQARLAAEVGVSRSTISRLVHGRINPSYRLARGVTDVLERRMGKPLDMREVFSTDGTYLTPSGCALCRCHGCLPDGAWDEDSHLKPGWEDARPGEWSLARADTLEAMNEELSEEKPGHVEKSDPVEKLDHEEEPNREGELYNEGLYNEELDGGFSGYGEYEEGDEETAARHCQAKLEAANLREASALEAANLRDEQGSGGLQESRNLNGSGDFSGSAR